MRTTTTMLLLGTLGIACQSEAVPKDEVAKAEPPTVESPLAAQTGLELDSPKEEEGVAEHSATLLARVEVERVGRAQTGPPPENVISRTMAVVDSNSDGNITREEAIGALNFVIGGFFFRADANADGQITPEERKEARADFASDYPVVHSLLTSLSTSAAVKTLMTSLDANIDQTVKLKQVRSTIREAVDAIFKAVDENADDIITAQEAAKSFNVAATAASRAAFKNADADSDGTVSVEEFQASLRAPLKLFFDAADANNDAKLSDDEASGVMWRFGELIEVASTRGPERPSNVTEASGAAGVAP